MSEIPATRERLIQAGLDLLAEGGMAALSLRACAARAGVSHAAPAHYFVGFSGLRDAIIEAGLIKFRDRMRAELPTDAAPRARLQAICRGYLAFALENRALFRLIFGFDDAVRAARDPRSDPTGAYAVLREAVAPFVPAGDDPTVTEIQVWSLIHGLTALFLSGRFAQIAADGDLKLVDSVLGLLDRIGNQSDA